MGKLDSSGSDPLCWSFFALHMSGLSTHTQNALGNHRHPIHTTWLKKKKKKHHKRVEQGLNPSCLDQLLHGEQKSLRFQLISSVPSCTSHSPRQTADGRSGQRGVPSTSRPSSCSGIERDLTIQPHKKGEEGLSCHPLEQGRRCPSSRCVWGGNAQVFPTSVKCSNAFTYTLGPTLPSCKTHPAVN